ncbi:hypothetical protein CK203_115418 [Vitis vinifera]|uniref:Uncharacterized protein n=1 Tax=Vitis vinifera TaxID=29760 RepID=A0A438D1I0_VITVI|nr:hypothetical protein CK203_115418 [Vitis vinifera]
MPRDHQEEEDTSVSHPYQLWRAPEGAIQTRPHLARLGQAPPLLRIHLRPLRPRPCHLLRVGVPSSPPQRRTLGPGETSSQAPADSQAQGDIQRPSGIAPEVIIKRPMVTAPPIPGNSNCRARPFHSKLYFDMEAMRQQTDLRDSFGLLQRRPKSHNHSFQHRRASGYLEAKHIAEALHSPFQLEDPEQFR